MQGAGGFMSGLYDFGLLRRLAWFDDYGLVIVIGVAELGDGHLGRDPDSQYEKGSIGSRIIERDGISKDDPQNNKMSNLASVSMLHKNRKFSLRIRALSSYLHSINIRVIYRIQIHHIRYIIKLFRKPAKAVQ